MDLFHAADQEREQLARRLLNSQSRCGAWRYCFEGGPMTDAYMVILLRTLESKEEELIGELARRLASSQRPNGAWKLYEDEGQDGNLSATIEAYAALLYAGYYPSSAPEMKRAEAFIVANGGLARAHPSTKFMLALNRLYPWPRFFPIPLWLMDLHRLPFGLRSFSAYVRVHIASVMIAVNCKSALPVGHTPDLSNLWGPGLQRKKRRLTVARSAALQEAFPASAGTKVRRLTRFAGNKRAVRKAEQFLLQSIEADGTLFNYASATFFMVYALLALGYRKDSPLISRAVAGLKAHLFLLRHTVHLQNSPSAVWDTALISHALQEAGIPADHPQLRLAAEYLLARQQRRPGPFAGQDSAEEFAAPKRGGWGFSETNTRNPDVDDTHAALRATLAYAGEAEPYGPAWLEGVNWLLSMQNSDGGWGSFEKNRFSRLVALLPVPGIRDVGLDPSTADITGRVLHFLGGSLKLTLNHPAVKAAAEWLIRNQTRDGSWYGRWGISYIYGTWAAVTGLAAVGCPAAHPAIGKAVSWLRSIQLPDGGFGESCKSDKLKRYTPLPFATPSQTAWALDALISAAAGEREQAAELSIRRGIRRLTESFGERAEAYPTGAGLPGQFYIRYHSYNLVWPLLALSHYCQKFGR